MSPTDKTTGSTTGSAPGSAPPQKTEGDAREQYGIEVVYVGLGSHLRRYMVVNADGKYVPGSLFRTEIEARNFVAARR